MEVRTILVPTDFSRASESALEYAAQLARGFGAQLIIAHVNPTLELPGEDDDVYDANEPKLLERLSSACPTDPSVRCAHQLLHGHPSDAILKLAAKRFVDLIVMGAHGKTNSSETMIGAVAEHVMRGATCPVLAVQRPTQVLANSS